jgi:diguanylate cyclase (GGDEF)-like protein/PAS domain S-box-containing protein
MTDSFPAHCLSNDALVALLDVLGANIFAKDLEGRYTFVNASLAQLVGVPREGMLLRKAQDFLDASHSAEVARHDAFVMERGETYEGEESLQLHDGTPRVFWTVKKPLRDIEGRVIGMCGVSTDITDRKAVEAQLREQRQLLDVVLNNIDAYVYMKDENRRYRYINERVALNLGVDAQAVVGKLDSDVVPKDWADKFWALDKKVFTSGQKQSGEEAHDGPDGERRHHWSIKVPVRYEGVPALIGFSTDITELVRLREQLRQQAVTDGLTGIFNRRHFTEVAEKELARARRHELSTTLLLIDIDHFKRVNDQHGHPAGDAVLQEVARRLKADVRQEDTVARMGGEEFAVLMPRTSLPIALRLAERIRAEFDGLQDLVPGVGGITVSMGAASCGGGELKLEKLYAQADQHLYQAKQDGRNRVCW